MNTLSNAPFALFSEWFQEATEREPSDVDAASIATVSPEGKPSIRMVLVRGISEQGFSFYTNLGSRKAQDLKLNPNIALCFHWKSIAKQIRIEGEARLVTDAAADVYFSSRPRESQIGAWASRQSEELANRKILETRFHEEQEKYADQDIPRPPFWSGFLLVPNVFEFWEKRPFRLHERRRFDLIAERWQQTSLYP